MRNWKLWVGVVISVASLAYFCRDLSPSEMWAAIRSANYIYLIPSVLLLFLGIYIRGLRWQLFFKQIRRISYNRLFAIETIGFMGNHLYPLRAGEIMRAYLLGRRERVGFSASLATIALERLFDLLAVVGALGIVFLAIPFPESAKQQHPEMFADLRKFGYGSGLSFIVLLAAVILMVYYPRACESVLRSLLRFVPRHLGERVFHLYQSFVGGLVVLRDGGAVLLSIAYTILIWLTIVGSEYMVVKAFGFAQISFIGALFLMVALALAVSLPQLPGYIGTFHLVVAWAVSLLGVEDPSTAKAFALVLWFVQMIPIILAGWVCLAWLGLSLGQLRKEAGGGPPGPDTEAGLPLSTVPSQE